jgi:hypothetical protein
MKKDEQRDKAEQLLVDVRKTIFVNFGSATMTRLGG